MEDRDKSTDDRLKLHLYTTLKDILLRKLIESKEQQTSFCKHKHSFSYYTLSCKFVMTDKLKYQCKLQIKCLLNFILL